MELSIKSVRLLVSKFVCCHGQPISAIKVNFVLLFVCLLVFVFVFVCFFVLFFVLFCFVFFLVFFLISSVNADIDLRVCFHFKCESRYRFTSLF